MSALDEKTKAERALQDLQKVQGEQQVMCLTDVQAMWHLYFAVKCVALVWIHPFLLLCVTCCHLLLSANLDFIWYVSS